YDFLLHLRNITGRSNVEEIVKRILSKSRDLSNFVFKDAKSYIENICDKCSVVLLSFGEVTYQQHKFLATGLDKHFHASIFTQIRKPEFFRQVLRKDEEGFILSVFP